MKGDEFNAEGQVVKRVEGVSASEGHDRSVEVAKILRAYLNEKQAPRMPAKEWGLGSGPEKNTMASGNRLRIIKEWDVQIFTSIETQVGLSLAESGLKWS